MGFSVQPHGVSIQNVPKPCQWLNTGGGRDEGQEPVFYPSAGTPWRGIPTPCPALSLLYPSFPHLSEVKGTGSMSLPPSYKLPTHLSKLKAHQPPEKESVFKSPATWEEL